MVTDPIADMLTRIRNAQLARHRRVDMPTSRLKVEVARLLKQNHYIHDYKLLEDGPHPVLRLYLKYFQDKPVIRELWPTRVFRSSEARWSAGSVWSTACCCSSMRAKGRFPRPASSCARHSRPVCG